MWKIFNKKKKSKTQVSNPLKERLDADMEYIGLDNDIQKGFLFFLGASINIGFKKTGINLTKFNANESEYLKNLERTIDAYSKSTGDFSDYGQLNDNIFTSYIYSINFVLHNILAGSNIDDQLKKVNIRDDAEPTIIGKSELIKEFVDPYRNSIDSNFKLNDYHNLVELFFKEIGKHLTQTGFDNNRSYEAGYAYFCMQCHFDIKGTTFLLETIYSMLTPLYMSLYNYPILNQFYPKELDANHIFSSTLQMFYGGIDPTIIQPIHRFHQHVFYSKPGWKFSSEKTSTNFSCPFSIVDDIKFQSTILHYAIRIKESGLADDKTPFIESGQVFNKGLIDLKIDINQFYGLIFKVVLNKYHIYPANKNNSENRPWNNLGDFIQYCAVLFYETAIHAAVVKEFTKNE
tara:strand:- start:612 stop:1820 length:1209 start_codon:yes stop_codon:yes gene_type:complete